MRFVVVLLSFCGLFVDHADSAVATSSQRPREGLLLETQVNHLGAFVKSRVVLDNESSKWVRIGEGHPKGMDKPGERFVIEARAAMLDAEVAEVEMRVRSHKIEESGKMLVRLGDFGLLTTAQLEATAGANTARATETKLGVRVFKVRLQ